MFCFILLRHVMFQRILSITVALIPLMTYGFSIPIGLRGFYSV